jgi:tetratricopeptide (TPR) repeat protein
MESSPSPQPLSQNALERFCVTCGARKQADAANDVVVQYCQSCGMAQYTLPQSTPQPAKGAGRSNTPLMVAAVMTLIIGASSYGITRLFVEKPAPNAAPQASSEQGSVGNAATGDASGNPMAKVSPEIQERIGMLRDSFAKNPNNGGLVVRMANAWYDAGAYFQAEQYYARYLKEFNPKDVAARVDYAYTLLRQGREDEAITETKRALEYEPDRVEAVYNLGVMYYGKKDYAAAKQWFEKCVNLAPGTEVAKSAEEIIKGLAKTMAEKQGS